MPRYDYRCRSCLHVVEFFQPMSVIEPKINCPICRSTRLSRYYGNQTLSFSGDFSTHDAPAGMNPRSKLTNKEIKAIEGTGKILMSSSEHESELKLVRKNLEKKRVIENAKTAERITKAVFKKNQ